MTKWILGILLILGWVGTAQAVEPEFYRVKFGDTLSSRFGKMAAASVCELNVELKRIKNCNSIIAGQWLQLPPNVNINTNSNRAARDDAPSTDVDACVNLGAAPFNRYLSPKLRLEGIEASPVLTAAEKIEAKVLVSTTKGMLGAITGDMVFKAMPFRSKNGQVKWVYNKKVCLPNQGGRLEPLRTWKLSTGTVIGEPPTCGNITPVLIPEAPIVRLPDPPASAPPPPAPVASAPVPATPASAPMPTIDTPAAVKVARDYDFDGIVWAGGDKDVRFAGTEDAGYPYIRNFGWGRYALGGGGWVSLWDGKTSDHFGFSGGLATFGLAQKSSFPSRRDIGLKLVYGEMWTHGHDRSGAYQQKSHVNLRCIGATYTDASREQGGETWLPEFSLSASYCDPLSQSKAHSYFGQPLDPSTLADVNYIAGVSAEVIIRKNFGDEGLAAKWQPTAEIGWNKTGPNPTSGHAYLGVRSTDKLWSVGVGKHWSSLGNTLGGTVKYNWGRAYKMKIQQERWAAMVNRLEGLGVAVD